MSVSNELPEAESDRNHLLASNAEIGAAKTSDLESVFDVARSVSSELLVFGAEGGVGLFDSESKGQFPNAEFRLDEFLLFLDVKLGKGLYLFSEMLILDRENVVPTDDLNIELGELYLEIEEWPFLSSDQTFFRARLGRFDIPYGEEYLTREVIDNPLISHSIADFWGTDEGVEILGQSEFVDYVFAVHNGGHPTSRDGNQDKAVTGRVGYEPFSWLRMSISASRSGDLDVENDGVSATYFGNGFFSPINHSEIIDTFKVELLEANLVLTWKSGHLWGGGGSIQFEQSGPETEEEHTGYYYQVGVVQTLFGKLYGAGRFSQVISDDGLKVTGQGDVETSQISGELTDNLWRLSLGLGYRVSSQLVLKSEFSMERGEDILGTDLTDRDMVSIELGFGF